MVPTSSLIDKDVKYILTTSIPFDHDIEVKIHWSDGKIYTVKWKLYNNHTFYTKDSYGGDDIMWKSTELYFGNNNFILSKPLQWTYPYTNTKVEETLLEKRRKLIRGILLSNKFYNDIINSILDYVS